MKQAILTKKQTIEFSECDIPVPGQNEILMKVKHIGICGSDIHAYYGEHPFMSFPIRLGHEMAGEVIKVGDGVTGISVGEHITVMPQQFCGTCESCRAGRYNICDKLEVIGCQSPGAAAEYFTVDASLVKIIPKGMSTQLAAMIEPAAVGVHAVRRVGSVKGLNVVVMGAGTIGNVTAQAALAEGAAKVLITDLSDYRLSIARECKIARTANTKETPMDKAIEEAFNGDKADIFFECVGIGQTVNQAIECSKKGHDIVVIGVFGQMPPINMALVQDKELRISGSLMYLESDFHDTMKYMMEKKINMDPLLSKKFPFSEYDKAFAYIEENKDISLKVIIEF